MYGHRKSLLQLPIRFQASIPTVGTSFPHLASPFTRLPLRCGGEKANSIEGEEEGEEGNG